MQRGIAGLFLIALILALGLAVLGSAFFLNIKIERSKITDFESCAKAGNPVMESYPRQCRSNGENFTEELPEEEKKKLVPPSPDLGTDSAKMCIQVITPAKNSKTSECKEFPTPCDVPEGWEKVGSCNNQQTSPDIINMLCAGPLAIEPNLGCPVGYHCGDIKTVGGESGGRCIKN